MNNTITLELTCGEGEPGAFYRGNYPEAQAWLSMNLDKVTIKPVRTHPRADWADAMYMAAIVPVEGVPAGILVQMQEAATRS